MLCAEMLIATNERLTSGMSLTRSAARGGARKILVDNPPRQLTPPPLSRPLDPPIRRSSPTRGRRQGGEGFSGT